MDIKTIIAKKRLGGARGELTADEIKYFVGKWSKGEISDAQAAALFSYIYVNGLTEDEIVLFVKEIAYSGEILDFNNISDKIVDKHSTGGVGDKTTLILMPVISALGLPVAKISSNSYAGSSGTIDKLMAIPGFRANIPIEVFEKNVKNIGIGIVNQDLNLAPVENKFYKMRNDIACKDSIVLIAISLMSLKIATGAKNLLFEINFGKGTYIENLNDARRLGKILVRIGKYFDKKVGYVISEMNEPIGKSVGNILEVKETIKALNGNMTNDLEEKIVSLASLSLSLANNEKDVNLNRAKILNVIKSGEALQKFKDMVVAQYGNTDYIDSVDKFKKAKYVLPVFATDSGYLSEIDVDVVESLSKYLGAVGNNYNDIDSSAGIIFEKKVGDEVQSGEILAYIHSDDEQRANGALNNLPDAFKYSQKSIKVKNKVIETYGI